MASAYFNLQPPFDRPVETYLLAFSSYAFCCSSFDNLWPEFAVPASIPRFQLRRSAEIKMGRTSLKYKVLVKMKLRKKKNYYNEEIIIYKNIIFKDVKTL